MSKNNYFVNNYTMRTNLTINQIKEKIDQIKGENIKMLVNKGHKRVEKIEGKIQDLYSSVFTVEIENKRLVTFSYTEVLCGFVKFVDNNL